MYHKYFICAAFIHFSGSWSLGFTSVKYWPLFIHFWSIYNGVYTFLVCAILAFVILLSIPIFAFLCLLYLLYVCILAVFCCFKSCTCCMSLSVCMFYSCFSYSTAIIFIFVMSVFFLWLYKISFHPTWTHLCIFFLPNHYCHITCKCTLKYFYLLQIFVPYI